MAAAHAKEHIVEFLSKVPAGLVGAANRVLHDALVADHLGSGQHILIGFRRLYTDFLKNVSAVDQMLCVRHEGDSHYLAVDCDKLVLLQMLAMLGNEIIQRTDDVFVHQRHNRRVGNNGRGVLGRVALHAGHVNLLVVGGEVCCHLGTGAFLRTRANGLDRWEFVTHDRNAGIDSTGHGGGTRQDGHDTGQC